MTNKIAHEIFRNQNNEILVRLKNERHYNEVYYYFLKLSLSKSSYDSWGLAQ